MSDDDTNGWQRIRYDQPAERVARITLARSEAANAQDYLMLSELNQAFDRAAQDPEVRCIVLAADGKHFSSGHDLRDATDICHLPTVGTQAHFDAPGAEGYMAREAEMYVGLCWRWRNIPKPTIASVQGKVIAGGLMLVWPMDLIVCSEDATFSDPVVAFGVNGHEYFVHPYEVGARMAKQMLFTGEALSAQDAYRLGMVNELVPRDELEERTLELARKVAAQPLMGLKLAKMSVNQALDNMGMWSTIQAAFGFHHLGHSHNQQRFGMAVDPEGASTIRRQAANPPR
jgi:enoyl-CoA hydratase